MADGDSTIRLDQGGINARILAKQAKVDFRRVESASRKIQTTFYSPEVKRLFVRYLNTMQLNIYLVSVIARTKLPHVVIEKVEGALKERLENLHAEVNDAIDSAEALCKTHGITRLATYDTEPLAIEVKVISSFGRRYLELMTKVDQLMPMLETLAIDDVIEVAQLDLQKALAKKSVRQVAGAARNLRDLPPAPMSKPRPSCCGSRRRGAARCPLSPHRLSPPWRWQPHRRGVNARALAGMPTSAPRTSSY